MSTFCLKSGTIMDGTGNKSYIGDVLVHNGRIQCISKTPLNVDCPTIDCTGKVIAPGFIDAHSHHDNCMYFKGDLPFTEPFLRQGITTYITGNCGVSAAGIYPGSSYGHGQSFMPPAPDGEEPNFPTYHAFFDYMRETGIRQNMAMLTGHGTALHSIVGPTPKGATSKENMKKVLYVLEEGLDAGAKGISFGLGYRPGTFVPDTEIREVAELAIRRNLPFSVHSRVMGSAMPNLYGDDFSIPHNVRWHRDFFNMFRGTGAKFHLSHLLFVGRKAWPSYDQMHELISEFIENGGVDFAFDMYSYIQGGTDIAIMIPPVFYENLPQIYTDKALIKKLDDALDQKARDRGMEASDIILSTPVDPELTQYRGMSMEEICEVRKMSLAELYMDIYKRTEGGAGVYLLIEQPEENVPKQMVHDKALYMTDAWVVPNSLQNPCAYGSLPKFLRIARETGNQTMEMTIAKMTGRTADRYNLSGRGYLRDGYYADITVFDAATIAETATVQQPESYAAGIEHVFINGEHVLNKGSLNKELRAGMVL
ncbi:amidohydrolase family protein [Clostridia bacterium OttesenSCG-928-F22]|nr:amidohydrolase family protein [Clostridia bacterium OttesenSCG-928-F22]